MTRVFKGTVALTAAFTLSVLLASPLSAGPAENLDATDLNGDNLVDRSEYQRRMTDRFFFLDVDRNGLLMVDELEAAGDAAFAEADTNADGSLSLREYYNSRVLDFQAADVNSDGVLSLDEVSTWSTR